MTPAQTAGLKLGEAIRNILCADSIANRYFEPDLRERMRQLCDEQMHRLGRESITEHRERLHNALLHWDGKKEPSRDHYKYRRIDL